MLRHRIPQYPITSPAGNCLDHGVDARRHDLMETRTGVEAHNWFGDIRFHPSTIVRPTSEKSWSRSSKTKQAIRRRYDILVNNAGVGRWLSLEETAP